MKYIREFNSFNGNINWDKSKVTHLIGKSITMSMTDIDRYVKGKISDISETTNNKGVVLYLEPYESGDGIKDGYGQLVILKDEMYFIHMSGDGKRHNIVSVDVESKSILDEIENTFFK